VNERLIAVQRWWWST